MKGAVRPILLLPTLGILILSCPSLNFSSDQPVPPVLQTTIRHTVIAPVYIPPATDLIFLSGLGFAVSVNIIKRLIPYLITNGRYGYPFSGNTSLEVLSRADQEPRGLPRASGVYVTEVTVGSPAEKAGIRAGDQSTDVARLRAGGDLMIAIDDFQVKTLSDFIGYLLRIKSPGDIVELSRLRDNQEFRVSLVLDRRPAP